MTQRATPLLDRARALVIFANRWFDSPRGQISLLTAVAVIYTLAYFGHPVLPGHDLTYPRGWWGWWDQGQYLKCAAGLAHGSLTRDTYWYPLGYPALGALFYRWAPEHAFFLPNIGCVLGITWLFYRMARKLISPLETIALMAGFVACYHGTLTESLAVPWNSIPTHFLSYAMIYMLVFQKVNAKRLLIAAFCLGLIYLCRTADMFCMGFILGVGLLQLPTWPKRVKTALLASIIVALFVGFVLGLNQLIFGAWRNSYDLNQIDIGFASYPLTYKFFWLFIDGVPFFQLSNTAVFSHFPWLVLAPPGIIYLLRHYSVKMLGLFLSIGATYGMYSAYNDFWPNNIFINHLIHYLAWTFPMLALFTYVGLKHAWKDPLARWSYCAIPLLIAPVYFLTLREHAMGRISALPSGTIELDVANDLSKADWVLFRGLSKLPTVEGLRPHAEFLAQQRSDGVGLLLSTSCRNKTMTLDGQDLVGLQDIEFGTFRWRVRPFAKALRTVTTYMSRGKIFALGKLREVDLAGLGGEPDGQPDEVIQVGSQFLPGLTSSDGQFISF